MGSQRVGHDWATKHTHTKSEAQFRKKQLKKKLPKECKQDWKECKGKEMTCKKNEVIELSEPSQIHIEKMM